MCTNSVDADFIRPIILIIVNIITGLIKYSILGKSFFSVDAIIVK